eukprot:758412-Hanusia_phi.AAC.5
MSLLAMLHVPLPPPCAALPLNSQERGPTRVGGGPGRSRSCSFSQLATIPPAQTCRIFDDQAVGIIVLEEDKDEEGAGGGGGGGAEEEEEDDNDEDEDEDEDEVVVVVVDDDDDEAGIAREAAYPLALLGVLYLPTST